MHHFADICTYEGIAGHFQSLCIPSEYALWASSCINDPFALQTPDGKRIDGSSNNIVKDTIHLAESILFSWSKNVRKHFKSDVCNPVITYEQIQEAQVFRRDNKPFSTGYIYIGQHFASLRRLCCPLTTNKIKRKALINTTFPFRESTYVGEI